MAGLKDVVTREYTINLHKRVLIRNIRGYYMECVMQGLEGSSSVLHFSVFCDGYPFKKRAPRAVKEIKKFAKLHMGTEDVRLAPELNQAIWKRGVKGVEYRLRLRISRKRNEEEDAKNPLFSYVEPVLVASAKGLQTVVVEEDA
ncbi:60S ribosomal protein L31-B [Saccharomyces cerevisiae]|nr:60S ribosomal protein L31-B [Saccharomyces cerevisiae]